MIVQNKKTFRLEQDDNGVIKLAQQLKSDDFTNYPFNFGRLDSIELQFDIEKTDESVDICGICSTVCLTKRHLSGLLFT